VRIVAVTAYPVPPRWLFVRVDTDEGIVGWGEASLEGHGRTVAAAVDEVTDELLGTDPLRIEETWQLLSRAGFYRGGPVFASVVSGIDQALWDISGKAHGVPVHELLGGPVRERVRVYSWIGGDVPSQVAEEAARRREQGFGAVKMNGTAQLAPIAAPAAAAEVVERVASVRDVLGPEGDIAVDFHGRVSTPMARRLLSMLEDLQPMFVEEPVLPEHGANLAALVASTSIPLATGERLYSRHEFRHAFEAGVAVVQPDVAHAGGISELRRIAAVAEMYDVSVAPHCPLGPIALAACLQVDFSVPNVLIQEQSLGIHYNVGSDLLDYLVDPDILRFEDGWLARPTRPGLGVEIDGDAVAKASARLVESGVHWRTPVWHHPDGSLAEW
jgi:galactonate dehydratase